MRQSEYIINKDDAKIFARCFYSDIAAYVQSHQEEFQRFIEEEKEDGQNQTASGNRVSQKKTE